MKTETENLRELDRWIAVNIFGWQEFREEEYPHRMLWREGEAGSPVWDEPDHYHEDPAAALAVLEKCAEKVKVIVALHEGKWTVAEKFIEWHRNMQIAETLPLALAKFAKVLYAK